MTRLGFAKRNRLLLLFAAASLVLGLWAEVFKGLKLSLWSDEMHSLFYANGYAHGGWHSLFFDNTPPTYYLLLRVWSRFVQSEWQGEWGWRSLSVVFSCLSVLALYVTALRFYGRKVAALAIILLSLNAVHWYYGVEIRAYSLFEFLSVVHLYFFLDTIRRKVISPAYLISGLAVLFAHYFGVFLLASELVFLFSQPGARKRGLLASSAALLGLAGAAIGIRFFVRFDSLGWLSYGSYGEVFLLPYLALKKVCCYSNSLLFLLLAALFWAPRRAKPFRFIILGSALLCVPVALITGYRPDVAQYFIYLIPCLSLLFAAFIVSLWASPRARRWAPPFMAAVLALNLWSAHYSWSTDRAGWREASKLIPKGPASVVILNGDSRLIFPYFTEHRTLIVYDGHVADRINGQLEGRFQATSEAWFISSPGWPRASDIRDQVKGELRKTGWSAAQEGMFEEKGVEPVYYARFVRRQS